MPSVLGQVSAGTLTKSALIHKTMIHYAAQDPGFFERVYFQTRSRVEHKVERREEI